MNVYLTVADVISATKDLAEHCPFICKPMPRRESAMARDYSVLKLYFKNTDQKYTFVCRNDIRLAMTLMFN